MSADSAKDYIEIKKGTGDRDSELSKRTIIYPFDRFEICIVLSPQNEFLGVSEIRIKKEFMDQFIKAGPKGFHDVEQYYKD